MNTVDIAVKLAKAYYAQPDFYNVSFGCGGMLHIVLDDGNLEDESIRYCIDETRACGELFGEALGEYLLILTPEQREQLYARYKEYGG